MFKTNLILLFIIVSLIAISKPKISHLRENTCEISIPSFLSLEHVFSSDSLKQNVQRKTQNELPFGSEILFNHAFPKTFETRYILTIDTLIDTIPYPHELEINEVIAFYKNLNNQIPIDNPVFNKIEFIRIGNYDNWEFNDSLLSTVGICLYKLPNINSNECYYVYNQTDRNNKTDRNFCYETGNLIVINKKSGKQYAINLFTYIGNEFIRLYRYFYIDKLGCIHLYELKSGEGNNYFKKTHIIRLGKNGELKIKEIK